MSNENLKKKWKTKSGLKAELYAYKEGQDYPYIGAYLRDDGKWVVSSWTEDIIYYSCEDSSHLDLVEVIPYENFKIDDKVLVSHNGEDWYRRYFAGVSKDDRPLAFCDGSDSWSFQGGVKHTWIYCKKWEGEE